MIDLSNISLQFDGKYLFENVNFKINAGDKICLVGANGSGKSSLLNIISGSLLPEAGKINKQKNISIGYLPQDQVVHKDKTLIDEAASALTKISDLQNLENGLLASLSKKNIDEEEKTELVNRLGKVQHDLQDHESYSAKSRVEKILIGLGFKEEDFNRLTNEFSGGWQMRIALAKILISDNDLLLLDEPTNHLDFNSLEWLVQFIKNYKGALIIVSHDRWFVNNTTNKTVEIFNREINIYNGNFDSYLNYKTEREQQLISLRKQQLKKIKDTKRFIERFRYKNTKAKQVQSRIKQLEKIELADIPVGEDEINIRFPVPPRSGVFNIQLNSVSKSYEKKVVLDEIDFRVNRGDKIAFVGPNGTGKSTLAKIIAGNLNFNSGERIEGHNTIISYYSQDVADNLSTELDVLETVDGIAPEKTLAQIRSLLGAFLFSGDDVFKKVSILSGGEKSRLALAKILLTKSNFIILDEPTNHLDYNSKKVLQKALINFSGSLILVSHDIDFLMPVVNKVIEINNGKIFTFNGGIDYYLKKRGNIIEDNSAHSAVTEIKTTAAKKELKRLQAEKRQAKYNATKNLIREISILEKKIEKLEKREKLLEQALANPDTYNDNKKAMELNNDFKVVKSELSETFDKWEKLSEELQRVESEFD